ncbi:MAG: hypothetical protein ABIL45_04410 [candidate division WOR-3 bacterium]
MILNLKIVKGKYYGIQRFQKYGKNYNSDMSFIVVKNKGTYIFDSLRVWFYYKKEGRIVDDDDDDLPRIEFGIKIPFNLNLYIEERKSGYGYLFDYSMEGNKIVLKEDAQILRYGYLEYHYYSSKSVLLLYKIEALRDLGKLEKEKVKVITYLIYKPTFIYSSIVILFTKDILREVF